MRTRSLSIGAQRWLVSVGSALAGLGACIALFRVLTGRSLPEAAAIVAVLCLASASGAFLALRSQSLRRLDRVLARRDEENLRFDTAINNMSQGLCFFDGDRRLIVCNHRYADLYKLPRDLIQPGTTLEQIVDHRYRIGCFPKMDSQAYLDWRGRIAIANAPSDSIVEQSDGRTIAIHHQPMPGRGWVATHEDITDRRRTEAEIERMARHDALTGLPNRMVFRERLERHLRAEGGGQVLAVLCIDLDRFKAVNDTLGHPVGDELLRAVARRLTDCVRDSDVVARLGGDEFAILQTGAPQPASAAALSERLVRAVAAPFDVAGHRVFVGASVGIALSPRDGLGADDLLKRADLALYAAKFAGGEQSRRFEPVMDQRVQDRRALETDLRDAVANGELELFYEPIFDLRRRRITAFEALPRWRHPTRGLLLPEQFIPLAEETGLMQPLADWVLREGLAQATQWPATIGVAIKLSSRQLETGDLAANVGAALAATRLAPARVDLEITESALAVDGAAHLKRLHRLLALGVRVSLDDFGVGGSSFGTLRSFPFSKLTIDRSFVRDVVANPQAAAIVRAITGLGSCLHVGIVAEGVDEAAQLEALVALGCENAQGDFLGRPGPAGHIAALLRREAAAVGEAAAAPRLALVQAVHSN